jgi:aldehyde dehydrogenase (NAD+)
MKPKEAVAAQREYFNTGATRPVSIRKLQLMKLKETILKFEEDIYTAMKEDLNKSKTETYLTEIGVVLEEITYTLKHVERWVKKERANDRLRRFRPSTLFKEPYGTVSSFLVEYRSAMYFSADGAIAAVTVRF